MTQKFCISFFAYGTQKYAECYADFKSVKIIGKNCKTEKVLSKISAS
jgi:hypothetical protein